MMISLKQAQKDPKFLAKFIKEHESDSADDKDFENVLNSMACGKSKAVREASHPVPSDD